MNRNRLLEMSLVLLLLSTPAGGCAAWETWRAGGKPAGGSTECICPVVESMRAGDSKEVAIDLVAERASARGFVGRCPDPECACEPIAVEAREVPKAGYRLGTLYRVAGTLTRSAAGFRLAASVVVPSPKAVAKS